MKELFFVTVMFLVLIIKTKPEQAVRTSKQVAKEAQVKDYYYSAQIAQYWHETNRAYGSRKQMMNKVNGIAYTKLASHGSKPVCKVTDAVLVASGVEGDGLTVEYTNVAW